MSDNTAQIRALLENWADAVHRGDLDVVLADHSPDVVMFDVPPPEDGVRGITAYRETWPPFFTWQRQGASFEIVSLAVTAGGRGLCVRSAALRHAAGAAARPQQSAPADSRAAAGWRPLGRHP